MPLIVAAASVCVSLPSMAASCFQLAALARIGVGTANDDVAAGDDVSAVAFAGGDVQPPGPPPAFVEQYGSNPAAVDVMLDAAADAVVDVACAALVAVDAALAAVVAVDAGLSLERPQPVTTAVTTRSTIDMTVALVAAPPTGGVTAAGPRHTRDRAR